MTITITIEAHPDRGEMRGQIDNAMSALGFQREAKIGQSVSTLPIAADVAGMWKRVADVAFTTEKLAERLGEGTTITDGEAEAIKASEAAPARVPGQPALGRSRRTKAEIAEDEARAARTPTQAVQSGIVVTSETGVTAEDVPLISTGEERIDPNHPEDSAEVQAADAADEAAETAATKTALTLDDVRRVVGLYVAKYGMQAATDPAAIIGCKMVDIPDTQEALAEAIAKVEQATEANPFERVVVGAAPKAETIKTATKDDVNAALLRYAAKYDGTTDQTKMPFTMEDGPRCLKARFGDNVARASQIPADPASYAQAVADIEEMIALNPFKRTAPVAS